MKKFSHIAAFFVLFASFAAPSLALAACPSGCFAGSGSQSNQCFYGDGSTCMSSGSSAGGVGVNTTYLDFYKGFIQGAVNDYLVPILFAVAFIVFLFGVYKYFILGAADEKSRTDGKQFVLWGIIGFVVISSVWGVVNIVKGTIIPSTAGSTHPDYPKL